MLVMGPRFDGLNLCGCLLQHAQLQQSEQEGPPCIRRYSATTPTLDPAIPLCRSEQEVEATLARTSFPFNFAFVDYLSRDRLAAVRKTRNDGKRVALDSIEEVSPVAKRAKAAGSKLEVECGHEVKYENDARKLFLCEDSDDE